ncbi:MAG TPA: alkaline phosphatase family protein [Methylovirgula sp.]|nr:alkaline phosphatase family protein [Methylovirgula sp.]
MRKTIIALAAATALVSLTAHGAELSQPQGHFGNLDHVFLIIMENQTNTDILGNPNAPFINAYAKTANQATNYFAVGHPSAPNYLEIVGGSNFGLTNDYWPNWVNTGCVDNAPGSTGCNNAFTPIAAPGLDNPVVATATTSSQCNGQVTITGTPAPNNCALYNYPARQFTPKSIADQLVEDHKTWKAYEESLPTVQPGVFGLNYSDGAYSNLSPASVFAPGPIQKLYAVKHNPFAYFNNIEVGERNSLSLARVVDFDGPNGLWADLQSSNTPNLSVIVPNQCHDMHGFVSGGTPICSASTAQEAGFLMLQGDAEVAKLVNGIKASPVWRQGRNAIVLVWDENDYSNAANRVVMLVDPNYAKGGNASSQPYDHFSLLRTLEAGFGLRCLNHACDSTSQVMDDLFGAGSR